jgi:hypothetical protein
MTERRLDDSPIVVPPAALAPPADEPRCDACNTALPAVDEDDGYDLPGHGIYVWTRGEEVRFEKVPLCPSCASAIGMTALARWEIEEEEG